MKLKVWGLGTRLVWLITILTRPRHIYSVLYNQCTLGKVKYDIIRSGYFYHYNGLIHHEELSAYWWRICNYVTVFHTQHSTQNLQNYANKHQTALIYHFYSKKYSFYITQYFENNIEVFHVWGDCILRCMKFHVIISKQNICCAKP